MTILAHFACSPAVDTPAGEAEGNSFRRARRTSNSSAEMDYSEKIEEEPEHVIRRLKYERDLLKHQLSLANKQKDELSLQVQGMTYSSSCPAFAPYLSSSPRRNPLSPNRPLSSPFSYLHNLPIDEEGAQLLNGDGSLIPANYPGHGANPAAMRSAASSPTLGVHRSHGQYLVGSCCSSTSLLDIPRARPPLYVNTAPRSRGTTPPVSPQQTSPNLSSGGGVLLDALDSIASSFSEAIRSDLQLLGLDLDEFENPDRKRADDLQLEVERLQRVLEVERQERKGLDCRIRELEHLVEGLKHERYDLMDQVSTLNSKLSGALGAGDMDSHSYDQAMVMDQISKPNKPLRLASPRVA